jgi:hypothetical protein
MKDIVQGGVFKLELFLPEDYPMSAPKVIIKHVSQCYRGPFALCELLTRISAGVRYMLTFLPSFFNTLTIL